VGLQLHAELEGHRRLADLADPHVDEDHLVESGRGAEVGRGVDDQVERLAGAELLQQPEIAEVVHPRDVEVGEKAAVVDDAQDVRFRQPHADLGGELGAHSGMATPSRRGSATPTIVPSSSISTAWTPPKNRSCFRRSVTGWSSVCLAFARIASSMSPSKKKRLSSQWTRPAATAFSRSIPWKSMLPITCASAGKMRTLPGVPTETRGFPFLKTIVGAMLATDRLLGPIEFGWPGNRSMSEMSSLSSTP